MTLYFKYLDDEQKQELREIDEKKARLKARNAEYTKRKAALVHLATERRRRDEARKKQN